MRRLAAVLLLLAAALVAPATAAYAETCSATLPHPDGHGITCLRVDRHPQGDGSELRDVTMTSTAIFQAAGGTPAIDPLAHEITVRVYLPPGYDPARSTRYRSLYLINGGGDNYTVSSSGVYDWPSADPAVLVTQGRYAPFSGRLGLYAGGCKTLPRDSSGAYVLGDGDDPAPAECGYSTTSPENTQAGGVNEAILGSYASVFDQTLTGLGVRHRYCYGTGGHDWNSWPAVLVDFLQYAYGTAPARCPNA
ncbi:hypothetical protein [Nonomuraea helvata]|uniref:Uncharacterized protein n=1 Tax=Nonomuraea helvata TaxID=37484 RepID=A0ABV5S157_9ACTN